MFLKKGQLATAAVLGMSLFVLYPKNAAGGKADATAIRTASNASRSNLKAISLAMYDYHDTRKHFPLQAISGKDGKPFLSWRVAILPYLDEQDLYKEFKLDEPWDSDHNKKLLARMPKVYRVSSQAQDATGTYYQVFFGKSAAFEANKKHTIGRIRDGPSDTILVIEGGATVPWTKPEDLPYDPDGKLPALGGAFKDHINAVMVAGFTVALKRGFDEKALRAAITPSGGERFDLKDIENPAPGFTDPKELEQMTFQLLKDYQKAQVEIQILERTCHDLLLKALPESKERRIEELGRMVRELDSAVEDARATANRLKKKIADLKKP